jgi:hypothetical protein
MANYCKTLKCSWTLQWGGSGGFLICIAASHAIGSSPYHIDAKTNALTGCEEPEYRMQGLENRMHGNHSDSTVIAIQKKENPAKKGSKFSYK